MLLTTMSSFAAFEECTPADGRRLIMNSLVKSCSLDPVSTFLVSEFIDVLLPYVTGMINACMIQGRIPTSQKHAVVTPLQENWA